MWLDALLFVALAAALFQGIGFLLTIPLNRWMRARQMRHLGEPVRRFGVEKARPLFERMQETGETPPELEPLLEELRERRWGGKNEWRVPPLWPFTLLVVVLSIALAGWLVYR